MQCINIVCIAVFVLKNDAFHLRIIWILNRFGENITLSFDHFFL